MLQAMSLDAGHKVLQRLAEATDTRRLIQGTGLVGDCKYVPWLIRQMRENTYARLAGEAFSIITGASLSLLELEDDRPANFESGPNDDPNDPNVDSDPDEGLPWPRVTKIESWWSTNASRFERGTRYFVGEPLTRFHLTTVLKRGNQRQRILAAHYLCLLDPGTPLFNTSAPAWRQQRWLAKM